MAQKRYIDTKLWSDNFIVGLKPLERYLFLYFLTNSHTNICGIYELPIKTMVFETSLDPKFIAETLSEVFVGKVYYVNGWIYIKNFIKNQVLNDSILRGIERILKDDIPLGILNEIKRVDTECLQSGDRVGTGKMLDNIYNIIKYKFKLSKVRYKYTSKDKELAELLYSLIKKENPAWYVEPNWDQWAEDIGKINRLDKRTHKQIEWMVRWAQKDDFWKKNILSPSKLRKQFNKLVVQAKGDKPKVAIIQ